MNKRTSTILTFIALLLLILVLIPLTRSNSSSESTTPDAQGKSKPHFSAADHAEASPSPRSHGDPSAGLHKNAKPAPPEPYTSRVTGEIQAGETLVFGGYLLPDGSHEFTFMTPRTVIQEDGSQAIKLEAKTMSIGPELTQQTGLDSLATQDRHSEQRAEAWSMEDVRSTQMKSSSEVGSRIMTSPSIMALPGQATRIHIGSQDGGPGYSLNTKVTLTPQGGFAIDSMVERIPAGQH